MGGWMSAADAASALGVRVPTLYSYVSRGVVQRQRVPGPDGRLVSRFDRDEVLALVRSRRPQRAGRTADLIESDITQLDPAGHLAYRDVDVSELVDRPFEHTVALLLETDQPWPKVPVMPSENLPSLDAIRAGLLRQAAGDPQRHALDPEHCRWVGLRAVEGAAVAVTGRSAGEGSIAERLALTWTGRANPSTVRALDTALVLLADHELTGSTLATRAAAGVHADPWMALLAGHAALGGMRQGSASVTVVRLVRAWSEGQVLPASGDALPGFGHLVYEGPDPRAEVLLDAVAGISPQVRADVEGLVVAVARERSQHPNVDVGLAALVVAADLPEDAGAVLYGVARLAGLAAHAAEEYPHEVRLRPRSVAVQASPTVP